MRTLYSLIIGASLSLTPVIALASTPAASASVADSPTLAATATAQPSPAAAKASSEDRARYAARETASPDAKNYRGGDTLVIGSTAAVAILAVILLVVLL